MSTLGVEDFAMGEKGERRRKLVSEGSYICMENIT